MANELAMSGKRDIAKKSASLAKKAPGAPLKKHAKKAAKNVGDSGEAGLTVARAKGDKALRKAFHHMQRASVVISLVDKGAGGDLADFLAKGIELFGVAVRVGGKHGSSDAALGVLRAAEHLGMAGLYAARVE